MSPLSPPKKKRNSKNPSLNRPSEYNPRGPILGNYPKIQNEKSENSTVTHIFFYY